MKKRIKNKREKANIIALLHKREAYIKRMNKHVHSLTAERDYYAEIDRILSAWIISLLADNGGVYVIPKEKISTALKNDAHAVIDCDENNYKIRLT